MISATNKRFAHVSNLNLTVQQHTQLILCRSENNKQHEVLDIFMLTYQKLIWSPFFVFLLAQNKNQTAMTQHRDQDFTQTRIK